MSIDVSDRTVVENSQILLDQWEPACEQIRKNVRRSDARKVFGNAAKRGSIYRWGLAVAKSADCDAVTDVLLRLAVGERIGKKQRQQVDLLSAAESFTEWLNSAKHHSASDATAAVVWAAALPALLEVLEPPVCSTLIASLQQFRESVLQRSDASSVSHLMIGVELGLTLAWRCDGLPGTSGLTASAAKLLVQWSEQGDESISAALEQPLEIRLVLASALRCQRLLGKTAKQRRIEKTNDVVDQLATWVCAMTVSSGSSFFSLATRGQVKDDLADDGLLAAASDVDPECLPGAISAALGKTPAGGRLAWQVTLPGAMHHDANAKVAVMFPDWDVRRGRTHVNYSGEDVAVELFAGRAKVVSGSWQTMIETDGAQQRPAGPWSEICEFSDDDVHYLELEQEWTDGLLLQRQFMLVRDDRCLLLADSVIPAESRATLPASIKYLSRIPLVPSIHLMPEPETREAFVGDERKRALVIPLSASEWTVGPTDAAIKQSTDDCLVYSSSGSGRLYAPLWFDFQRRRFKRMRTWRQLTIADQLRLVGPDEAVGYRIQVGSEQWVVYRSLGDRACRSFLGKHSIADFFSARFDPEDGGHEALVTIDDDEHSE